MSSSISMTSSKSGKTTADTCTISVRDDDFTASSNNEVSPTTATISQEDSTLGPLVQVDMPIFQEVVFIGSICLGQFLTLSPLGQVLAPIRIIGQSFDETNVSQLSWYMTAYALTSGTFILLCGSVGDRFGYKRCFLLSILWLGIWSFIAGFTVYTGSEIFFDICRGMQGLGGAMMTPNALALIGATYPPGVKKGVFFCLFGSMAATGFFTTSIFASLLAERAWWPWTFWIYAIVAALVTLTAYWAIPHQFMRRPGNESKLPPFDWLGSFTGPAGLIFFNVAWNQAPTAGWGEPYVIVLLILGVVLMGAFVFIERKAGSPLVPVKELSNGVILVLLCILFGWMSFGIFLYYWWQFVEIVQGASPLEAVARHVPGLVFALVAAGVVAAVVTKVRSCWIMLGAELAFVAANVLLATVDPDILYWKQMFWTVVIIPFGMDMTFPAASLMLSNLVPARHQGIAAGLIATLANYAIALGLGFAGTVEVHFNDGGKDPLTGYRSALYFSCGSAGLGLLVAIYLVIRDYTKPLKAADVEQ